MTVKYFPDARLASAHLARVFFSEAASAIQKKSQFLVAVPGGSSPFTFFDMLSGNSSGFAEWRHVHFFWTDERWVPHTSPESNYMNALAHGLKMIPANFYPYRTDGAIHVECQRYEALLNTISQPDGKLDLIITGMGADGHVASIFPGGQSGDAHQWVIATHHPQTLQQRIGLSIPYLTSARHVVLFVLGSAKADVLKKALAHQLPGVPVQKLIEQSQKLTIVTDCHV